MRMKPFFVGMFAVLGILFLVWLASYHSSVSSMPGTSSGVERWHSPIDGLVEQCMRSAHLTTPSLLQQAQWNAGRLLRVYQQVIPETSLDGMANHCWKGVYVAYWYKSDYQGTVGDVHFRGKVKNDSRLLANLDRVFPHHHFNTINITCLPNVYLTGFPKCGSSYAYCLINKLVFPADKYSSAFKEPQFWVSKTPTLPSPADIGSYLLYFLSRLKHLDHAFNHLDTHQLLLLDGTVNKMFKWPHFSSKEDSLANYCLLPTVMPKLFPRAKFITVIREPISMLYSTFWYSCSRLKESIPIEIQRKGPNVFHEKVVEKLNAFNQCMKDSSTPSLSQACELNSEHNYSSCILQRLHLLDRCAFKISPAIQSPEMPCGKVRITMGLYFVHVRKWLSVVSKKRFFFLTLDNLVNNLNSTLHDILQFLDVDNMEDKMKYFGGIAKSCDQFGQRKIHYRTDAQLQMRQDTQALLEAFYEPFNMLLSHLIGKDLPWHYQTSR